MNKEILHKFNCVSMASISSEKPCQVFAIICDNKVVNINSEAVKALVNILKYGNCFPLQLLYSSKVVEFTNFRKSSVFIGNTC